MKKSLVILSIALLVLAANYSDNKRSTEKRPKPSVNFSGTVTDVSGKTMKVKNLVIDRQHEQIKVYGPGVYDPKHPTVLKKDPEHQKTLLDLNEVKILERDKKDSKVVYQGEGQGKKKYVKIIVTFTDGSVRNYLAKTRTPIHCDEDLKSGPNEKQLSFLGIDKIEIEKYKASDSEDKN
ncbi:hypothetical protein HN446_00905 [bacterium]|jgi:hypothetical protein|nr:hypothetical protein [bacterium]